MFELQKKIKEFSQNLILISEKKNFLQKLLTKLTRFWLKSVILIEKMIADHFTITHKKYEPRSLTIMIARFRKI